MQILKKIILTILFIIVLTPFSYAWWDVNWQSRQKLTLDNSQQDYYLTNFTTLIVLNTTNFNYANAKSDASDLRFIFSDNSTELKWHVDTWDYNGISYLWVKVPYINNLSNSGYIWLYYNNPSASDNQNESGTYDEYFIGVWHLNESSGSVFDSTSNNLDATNNDAKYNSSSYIGGGYFVNDNDDYLYVGDDAVLDSDTLTIEAMVNFLPSSTTFICSIVDKRDSATDGYVLRKSSSDDMEILANTAVTPTAPSVTYGTWDYYVGSKALDKLRIYYNARYEGATTTTQSISTTQDLALGNNAYHYANPAQASFDEIRISNIQRDYWWINASWRSITNQFVSFGSEESGASFTLNTDLVNNTINYNNQSINFTYNATFSEHDTDLANCSFYQQGILNQTLSNVNLSNNNKYNITIDNDFVGEYNISFNCTSGLIEAESGVYYYLIDLTLPAIFSDFVNNSYHSVNDTLIFYFNTSDANLFQWNSTAFRQNGSVYFNRFLTNITTTFEENTTIIVLNETGNFTWLVEVIDSHTGYVIADYNWTKYTAQDSNNVTFKGISFANNKFNMSTYDYDKIQDWALEKQTDRYLEAYNFTQIGFWYKKYIRTVKTIQYLPDSDYQGHFIVGKNHWIDHVPKNESSISNFSVTYKSNYDAWEVKFYVEGYEVEFQSIGDLNENSKTWNFGVYGCSEDWQENTIICLINDTYIKTYYDANACGNYPYLIEPPADNGTEQSCNYCSENLQSIVGTCTLYNNQTLQYIDNNYISCCLVTGLVSDCSVIHTYPYNETTSQACTYFNNTMGNITCQSQFNFGIREKEYCLARIPNEYVNESFKCISYVQKVSSGEIMQTNPEYRERTTTLLDVGNDPESREYFEPANNLINFYFTKKNLNPDNEYLLVIECSSLQRNLASGQTFEIGYEDFEWVFHRIFWLKSQWGYIFAGLFISFVVLGLIAIWLGYWSKK